MLRASPELCLLGGGGGGGGGGSGGGGGATVAAALPPEAEALVMPPLLPVVPALPPTWALRRLIFRQTDCSTEDKLLQRPPCAFTKSSTRRNASLASVRGSASNVC